ncbi:hypothetical protein vBSenM1_68 [Salmonella phage vB_SenM-1]|uniref:Uncharacterized protein n=2 Tax=Rosemountvirus SE13 TaxID=2846100 RepID=A0A6G8RAB6_9CAUD|nr:hypothetical protein brorfarstad_60 [Salmonella phage brorfarstad]QJQ40068.1 hypothetical protein vBSenM1_68 [Salmonella phage vB_SenM-1]
MTEPKSFDIDDVTYNMTLANALQAWSVLKKAGKLFKGIGNADIVGKDGKVDGKKAMLVLLDAVLENAGSDEMTAIEELIFRNTVVVVDGKPRKLSDCKDQHFNAYRSHIFGVLKEGLVYQFADFFKGNGLSGLAGLATPLTK